MNKLIQVNIGGLVFQIDEGAYHKLDNTSAPSAIAMRRRKVGKISCTISKPALPNCSLNAPVPMVRS